MIENPCMETLSGFLLLELADEKDIRIPFIVACIPHTKNIYLHKNESEIIFQNKFWNALSMKSKA